MVSFQERRLQELLRNSSFPEDHLFTQQPSYLEDLLHVFITGRLAESGLLVRLTAANNEVKRLLRKQWFFLSQQQGMEGNYNNDPEFDSRSQDYQRLLFLLATIYDPQEGLSRKIHDVFFLRNIDKQELAELLGQSTISFEEAFYFRSFGAKKYLSKFTSLQTFYVQFDEWLRRFRTLYTNVLNDKLSDRNLHVDRDNLMKEKEAICNYSASKRPSLAIGQMHSVAYDDWLHDPLSQEVVVLSSIYETTTSAVLQSAKSLVQCSPVFPFANRQQCLSNLRKQWHLLQLSDTLKAQLLIYKEELSTFHLEMLTRAHDQIMVTRTLQNFPTDFTDSSSDTESPPPRSPYSQQLSPEHLFPFSQVEEFWYWLQLLIALSLIPVFSWLTYVIFRTICSYRNHRRQGTKNQNRCSAYGWLFCGCK